MPVKKQKSEKEIFDKSIAPTLDKLIKLCEKHQLPMHFAVQVRNESDTKKIVTEFLYKEKADNVFNLVSKMTQGKFAMIELGNGDFYLQLKQDSATINEYSGKDDLDSLLNSPRFVPHNGRIH